jgi:RNA polymerase sigma-32 factor
MGLSKERIRQVEAAAFRKMRATLDEKMPEAGAFFH